MSALDNALDELANISQTDTTEAREEVSELRKVRALANTVIEGWELFGSVSMADMDKLRNALRGE